MKPEDFRPLHYIACQTASGRILGNSLTADSSIARAVLMSAAAEWFDRVVAPEWPRGQLEPYVPWFEVRVR